MKNNRENFIIILSSIIVVACVITVMTIFSDALIKTKEKTSVAATIFPVFDITKNIVGDKLDVHLIIPPGASPHTFEPTPSTLRAIIDTKVVYAIGYGFDDWVDPLIETVDSEKIIVDKGIVLRENIEHEEDLDNEEADHDHGAVDPHYWLNPVNAKFIAQTITEDLVKRFPEYKQTFESNLSDYRFKLDKLFVESQEKISNVQNKNLITMHDAWYYFSDAFGLNIVGTFEPTAGREPTPQYLRDILKAVDEAGVNTIYSEPQLGTAEIDSFADDYELEIRELDPIGGVLERQSYIELIQYNVSQIK